MKKVLVANRGEIARRIIRTLKKMNITSVAVYSEADRRAPFVMEADEAYLIGPAPSSESYLRAEKILECAKNSDVDGIHPGYGFLSENSQFAKACQEQGIIFIGPSEAAIDLMGSKLDSKRSVQERGVPLVPGTEHAISDIELAKKRAAEIGYPILIKASAGGGGKGMRLVQSEEEFEEQMNMAQGEARSAFGDDSVFIEKFVLSPRHIEIQVLADNHGNVIHLFERECSIQRRHQKVVEEAPSSVLSPELRKEMGAKAIEVAKACNYSGAGTVEFLLDANQKFYFLEMNTRLQVEHPVTEMITGVDLVEEQIRVARGEKLRDELYNLEIKGHAMELRVYAEDALDNFAPSIGTLKNYIEPVGEGIRVDSGYEEGMEIPIYYDPMISKLITHSDTRDRSISLMKRAIQDYKIEGPETTLKFGSFVMNHESFLSGNFDTNFIKEHYSKDKFIEQQSTQLEAAGVFAAWLTNNTTS